MIIIFDCGSLAGLIMTLTFGKLYLNGSKKVSTPSVANNKLSVYSGGFIWKISAKSNLSHTLKSRNVIPNVKVKIKFFSCAENAFVCSNLVGGAFVTPLMEIHVDELILQKNETCQSRNWVKIC